MDKADRIRTLTKKEVAVLFLICMGFTNPEIEQELHLLAKTRSSQMTRIYEKLEIKGKVEDKRNNLIREYCKVVKEIVTPEAIKNWIPIQPPNKQEQQRYIAIQRLYPDPEDSLFTGQPQPPENSQQPIITLIDRRRVFRLLGILLVIIASLIIIILILLRFRIPQIPLIFATRTPENTATPSFTPTTKATITATATFTQTPSPTFTGTSTSTFTSTFTSTPTYTATATPETILFEDDFLHGLGKWTIYDTNHAFTGDGWFFSDSFRGVWISTAITATNFKISAIIDGGGTGLPGIVISPAFTDPNNSWWFISNACDRGWTVKLNNQEKILSSYERECFDAGALYEIIVEDGTMTAYINHIKIGSTYNDKVPFGKIGLWVGMGKIGQVKVISYP